VLLGRVKFFGLLTRFNGTGIGHETFLREITEWGKTELQSHQQTVLIHANVELTVKALETIVQTAKQITGKNSKGHWQVDTADVVSRLISMFLIEKDFESFTQNPDNYHF
jgi:hypothetical protein